jgi:hypothetical protein
LIATLDEFILGIVETCDASDHPNRCNSPAIEMNSAGECLMEAFGPTILRGRSVPAQSPPEYLSP